MDSLPPADPDLALAALAARIERELARLRGEGVSQTELVGGWAKIGTALDHLLRAAFVQLCADAGLSPGETFARASRDGWSLERASAGQLLYAARVVAPASRASSPLLARLAARLEDRTIASAIELRNVLIHARREPSRVELDATLRALGAWVATVRNPMG